MRSSNDKHNDIGAVVACLNEKLGALETKYTTFVKHCSGLLAERSASPHKRTAEWRPPEKQSLNAPEAPRSRLLIALKSVDSLKQTLILSCSVHREEIDCVFKELKESVKLSQTDSKLSAENSNLKAKILFFKGKLATVNEQLKRSPIKRLLEELEARDKLLKDNENDMELVARELEKTRRELAKLKESLLNQQAARPTPTKNTSLAQLRRHRNEFREWKEKHLHSFSKCQDDINTKEETLQALVALLYRRVNYQNGLTKELLGEYQKLQAKLPGTDLQAMNELKDKLNHSISRFEIEHPVQLATHSESCKIKELTHLIELKNQELEKLRMSDLAVQFEALAREHSNLKEVNEKQLVVEKQFRFLMSDYQTMQSSKPQDSGVKTTIELALQSFEFYVEGLFSRISRQVKGLNRQFRLSREKSAGKVQELTQNLNSLHKDYREGTKGLQDHITQLNRELTQLNEQLLALEGENDSLTAQYSELLLSYNSLHESSSTRPQLTTPSTELLEAAPMTPVKALQIGDTFWLCSKRSSLYS